MFDRVDDTITAISSPPGTSVRGIIRLSGPAALPIAAHIFSSHMVLDWSHLPGHRRIEGTVRLDENIHLPGEVYVFRAPFSYTRQDVVELHLIGSPPVLAMVLEQFVRQGARIAEPGEFSARAFFAGAMDLMKVEGVAEMIHAQNDSQLRASQKLLHGELSQRVGQMRERLTEILALVEAQIDFAEEPITFITSPQLTESLHTLHHQLQTLLRQTPRTESLNLLPHVLLVGRPNSGKSTLFNRLTGLSRAIASATAGTTRDILSAPLKVPGGEVVLLDSAGMECEYIHHAELQTKAAAITRRTTAIADLVLLVLDASQPTNYKDYRQLTFGRPFIWVLNKMDAADPSAVFQLQRQLTSDGSSAISLSARTGQNVETLRDHIAKSLFLKAFSSGGELLAISARQSAALHEAADALERAIIMCNQHTSDDSGASELVAMELRQALHAFSLLSGEVTTDDLLARVFERFCIGK